MISALDILKYAGCGLFVASLCANFIGYNYYTSQIDNLNQQIAAQAAQTTAKTVETQQKHIEIVDKVIIQRDEAVEQVKKETEERVNRIDEVKNDSWGDTLLPESALNSLHKGSNRTGN